MGWILGGVADTLAVHAALLPTGHILYFGGTDYNPNAHSVFHARLFNCANFEISLIEPPATDVFCCGHSLVEGSRLIVAGGTAVYPDGTGPHGVLGHWNGTRDTWIFDWRFTRWAGGAVMNPWLRGAMMNPSPPPLRPGGGRWYPTLLTLRDGRVLAMGGHPEAIDKPVGRHANNTPEIYTPETNSWALRPLIGDQDDLILYPRIHLLPNGEVFCATPFEHSEHPERGKKSAIYNPDTGQTNYLYRVPIEDYADKERLEAKLNTSSVMLPLLKPHYRPRVLFCGSATALRIDLGETTPAWRPTGPRTLPGQPVRYNLSAVLLPTGDVFVSGGVSRADLNDNTGKMDGRPYRAELYRPDSDSWETLEAPTVVRNYHSTALLMPDGRVWTAGSNMNAEHSGPVDTHQPQIEVYEPWYVQRQRPVIASCPDGFTYFRSPADAFSYRVRTAQAGTIRRVALLRAGSCTHAFDSDQRYVELDFRVAGPDLIEVSPPPSAGIAPPGDYLLFILDADMVPSVGKFAWVGNGPPGRLPWAARPQVRGLVGIPNRDGRIELLALGDPTGAVLHRWQTAPNGPFDEWNVMGGGARALFAIRNLDARISVFAIGQDNAMWQRRQIRPNGPFTQWHSMGGGPLSQPFAVQNLDGRIELFAIGKGGAVRHCWQIAPNGDFADWHSLGGSVRQPFAIRNQDGRIELFAVGLDNAIWHRWQGKPNGPFADWHAMDGSPVSEPFAIHNQDGRIELFAIGQGGALWHRWQTRPSGPFAPWQSLGGSVRQPFAIANQDGRIEVFAIGLDDAMWHRWQTKPNGPFAEWHSMGGAPLRQPFAIHNQDGRIELLAIAQGGAVRHCWQTAPNGPFTEWHVLD